MNEERYSRRRFLIKAAVAAAVVPLLGRVGPALAAPLPKLPVTNAQAKALSYIEDAGKTRNPARKPASVCLNCQFFTAATGACSLFPGFSVAPKGWCAAWAKKAG